MKFTTDYQDILGQMESIDPISYGATRNYSDGTVTKLSPYISRGVISTKQVYQSILARGFNTYHSNKLIQELAWRDYWQQVWICKGDAINQDLKHPQPDVENLEMPQSIVEAKTGIDAVDSALERFYETGYMHNHMRMYVASMACNLGKSHWQVPAKWMYYHLLDADWASNSLSWQWVAGANSNKKYYANQENINTHFYSNQKETFLDVEYEAFPSMQIPEDLKTLTSPALKTALPGKQPMAVDSKKPTCIYNFYNLDPQWKKDLPANRILLLEPAHFAQFPISNHTLQFVLNLSKNIPDTQVFVGSFGELVQTYQLKEIHFKEHPLNHHYQGVEDPRDWMFSVKGYFPSFFAFWKKCKKEIPKLQEGELVPIDIETEKHTK
ncbi:MAG: deoxyribodipyrimidine photo-lyase [Cyclobacteriaceae bacterium]|jgi:deoxyribodipyrimidine photo-lyase